MWRLRRSRHGGARDFVGDGTFDRARGGGGVEWGGVGKGL